MARCVAGESPRVDLDYICLPVFVRVNRFNGFKCAGRVCRMSGDACKGSAVGIAAAAACRVYMTYPAGVENCPGRAVGCVELG